LIPGFYEIRETLKDAGALGKWGISGSGPTAFALSKGAETSTKFAAQHKKSIKTNRFRK